MVKYQDLQAMLKQAGTTYPRVTNLRNSSVRERINSSIKRAAFDAIPDWDPGTSVITAQSSYNVTVNQNGILSLSFQDYYYPEMAAHGVTQVSSVTVDLETGHTYSFNELFQRGSDYQAQLTRIIEAQIVARQIPMLKPYEGVSRNEQYYLTPDNLVIYYQPYVYTPGAYGVLEFPIPYNQIRDLIDPRGPIGKLLRVY